MSAVWARIRQRPLRAAAEDDLDHGHREDDYHESGDDRGKHRVAQPEPGDEEVGAGYGKQQQDRQDRGGSAPGTETGHRRECKSGVAWSAVLHAGSSHDSSISEVLRRLLEPKNSNGPFRIQGARR